MPSQLIDAFPGNREAERYLRGVAHVVMRNHTMPHRSRVAMMKFSVQNIKVSGVRAIVHDLCRAGMCAATLLGRGR